MLKRISATGPFIVFIVIVCVWFAIGLATGRINSMPQGDEQDYVMRGTRFARSGFEAMSDGYRPPLYVMIIGGMSLLFGDENILKAARILNVSLMSMVPAMWVYSRYMSGTNKCVSNSMAVLTGIWPSFYHFSTVAVAEPLSFFLLNIVLIMCAGVLDARNNEVIIRSCISAFVIVLLFLTKANNLTIAPVIVIFTLLGQYRTRSDNVKAAVVISTMVVLLSLPWLLFMRAATGEWKMTTTAGMNLLLGTGHSFLGAVDYVDTTVLHHKYMSAVNNYRESVLGPSLLSDEENRSLLLARSGDLNKFDDLTKKIAIAVWRENIVEQVKNGTLKILHSLGFSFRGAGDVFVAIFTTLVIVCSVYCIKFGVMIRIILLHWGLAFSGFFVSFFFPGDIRFKVFYFDSSGLLVLAVTLCGVLSVAGLCCLSDKLKSATSNCNV